METIQRVLIKRDHITIEDADDLIAQAKTDLQEQLANGEMPFDICMEYFNLEPDYIMELI